MDGQSVFLSCCRSQNTHNFLYLEFRLTVEDGGDHNGLVDGEQESGRVAHQEGRHGAQQDGGARQIGLLCDTLRLGLGLAGDKTGGDRLVFLELPVDDDV